MNRSIKTMMLIAWLFAISGHASAQNLFSSGSTAAQGAFPPAAIANANGVATLTLDLKTGGVTAATSAGTAIATATLTGGASSGDAFPTGDLDFITFNVPSGVTLKFAANTANTPVTIRTTGDVTIVGTIDIKGGTGTSAGNTGVAGISVGGKGGIGAGDGGKGGSPSTGVSTATKGAPGLGRNGGKPGTQNPVCGDTTGASFPHGNANLIPLTGGSGGGGGVGGLNTSNGGGAGGGGGGAILIASSTKISVTGTIDATGGSGGNNSVSGGCVNSDAGAGSGGAGGGIRLMSNRVEISGALKATGGSGGPSAGSGGPGIVRVEALDFAISGTATFSPVATSAPPGLLRPTNLPRLRISSIGGVSVPDTLNGVTGLTDISIPNGTNPMTVAVVGTNVPDGTQITFSMKTSEGAEVTATANLATVASIPTASVTMTVPSGISYFQAYSATFTVSAELQRDLPLFKGEKILKASVEFDGQREHTYFYTGSGQRVAAETLLGGSK